MTFIVEDGTGLVDSNSYVSVEYADTYFATRGISGWVGTSQQKQSYLIRATDFLETKAYYGIKAHRQALQALAFPRYGLWVDGIQMLGVPVKIQMATCEAALRAITGLLHPDLDMKDPKSGTVKRVRRETKGVQSSGIIKEFEYFDSAQALLGVNKIPAVDQLLKGYVINNNLETFR